MSDCIFCKIISGDIPCYKIWEDEHFLAILDIFPSKKGQTLVIPKNHQTSDVSLLEDKAYQELFLAAKRIITLLKKGLGVERVGLVVEGLEVNHAHIKLYPFYNNEGFKNSPLSGEKANDKELQMLCNSLK